MLSFQVRNRPDCGNKTATATPIRQEKNMLHFYFKAGSEKKLEKLFPQGEGLTFALSTQLKVEKQLSTGQLFAKIYEDPFDPTATIPSIPDDLLERVTVRGVSIDNIRCFRIEGIYEFKGAILRCSQYKRVVDSGMSSYDQVLMGQFVDVTAPNLETLREIYNLFRQGKLLPKEDWEVPQVAPEAGFDFT
jgi:hypothetical protein